VDIAPLDDLPGAVDVATRPGAARAAAAQAGSAQGAATRATVTLDGVPFPITPHHCFACGALNVQGLGLALHAEGDTCWTEISLPDRFEGWQGIAHGGIICTILDEVMAWSLAARDAWGLTARMTVDFKRPVPIGVPIRAEGRLVNARRRLMETTAHLVDASSGELLATAEGTYVMASADGKAELKRRYGLDGDVPESRGGTGP
jgi:uncharacterized protein (TIGR00369 family)